MNCFLLWFVIKLSNSFSLFSSIALQLFVSFRLKVYMVVFVFFISTLLRPRSVGLDFSLKAIEICRAQA